MIDKDTLRIARRTVERNGYTVLPPRESDERDLDRFRNRREWARQSNDDDEDYRTSRPTTRRPRYEDDDYEENSKEDFFYINEYFIIRMIIIDINNSDKSINEYFITK